MFPLSSHGSVCLISGKTVNHDKIQLANRWKILSSRGFVRSSGNLIFGQVSPAVLISGESLTHRYGLSLFISGFSDAAIGYGHFYAVYRCFIAMSWWNLPGNAICVLGIRIFQFLSLRMSCVAANCWKANDICSVKEHNKSFVDESHLLKLGLPCGHSGKQNKYMKINTNLTTVKPINLISNAGLEPTIKSIQTKTTATYNPTDENGTGIFRIASYNINDKLDLPVKQIPYIDEIGRLAGSFIVQKKNISIEPYFFFSCNLSESILQSQLSFPNEEINSENLLQGNILSSILGIQPSDWLQQMMVSRIKIRKRLDGIVMDIMDIVACECVYDDGSYAKGLIIQDGVSYATGTSHYEDLIADDPKMDHPQGI